MFSLFSERRGTEGDPKPLTLNFKRKGQTERGRVVVCGREREEEGENKRERERNKAKRTQGYSELEAMGVKIKKKNAQDYGELEAMGVKIDLVDLADPTALNSGVCLNPKP